MPRAPQPGREIRRRSRNGCWNCKARKVKCGEEKPRCANCTRLDEDCDYKIRLSWGGRPLKKKLLEQGAQIDDPSQNIPGAGQFSINQFNPVPSQSQQQRMNTSSLTPATSANPKSAGARKSSKASPTKSRTVFQNVFPVCGVTSQPMMTNTTVATSPFYVSPTYPQQHPHHSIYQGLWTSEGEHQQPLTPATSLPSDNQFSMKEEAFSFPGNVGGPYATQMASPTPSLSNVAMSPETANSSMPSPQQSYADHIVYNQQPMIAGSSPERIKTSASPEMQYRMMPHESTSAMSSGMVVPSSGPLGHPLEYITGPLTPPQMSTDIQSFPMKENARRLSVQNLLTTPLPSQHDFSSYEDGYSQTAIDPSLTDEGVEEIPRYDEKKFPTQQSFLGASGPLGSVDSHPVYQSIPRSLHPLPAMLMDNVESAMYFHHFLTHTASLLVPHDCGRNPFKTILPQMAMQKDSLLNLLLAYSASHQSHLLNRAEPTERISGFLGETVRSLTESLNDPVALKSDATLATAIMLCSYEIISPNSFAEGITWQTHLNAVRKIIIARGGAEHMHSRDEVSYFLSRWFAYLDVLGSLSGKDPHPLFKGDYWILDDNNGTSDFSVDCFFGTTYRFVSLLAQVGDLARRCDQSKRRYVERYRRLGFSSTASEWVPDGEIYREAVRLKNELDESRQCALETCTHRMHDEDEEGRVFGVPTSHEQDQQELLATNDAYHWAAQVHLARRVFNFPTEHAAVQDQVRQILDAMDKVNEDGNAINCWLFPMFIAGCESVDNKGRDKILQKMLSMERSGLTQIQKARILMEKVWKSGNPWETLTNGEFIG